MVLDEIMKTENLQAAEEVTRMASYGLGFGTAAFAFIDAHAMGIGAICAFVTMLVNARLAFLRNKREREAHEKQIKGD